ncbi:unnamed protein product [Protopolystoma xenopodis]|uniref:Uncharacterized protein n=1 Tax=Protopolystoma xenopodis TaxID=117903 RepID=A0A3S5CPH6_9PLAT|nr:unnamed protein product [Protopolystoma xenopodis]
MIREDGGARTFLKSILLFLLQPPPLKEYTCLQPGALEKRYRCTDKRAVGYTHRLARANPVSAIDLPVEPELPA